jgi:DNA polymerase-3 subunit gamma/tau
MSYLVFARKYRPKTFEEMIGQKPIVQTLQNAIKTNRIAQAYIFSGMRGIGKTTAARILAKALNCQHGPTPTPCNKCEYCEAINEDRAMDVLEIDGASNGGIEQIRSLRESVKYKPIHSRYKIIIIDEVHQVTGPAFNALLKTLEEPPPNTVFIFATTEFHKIPGTIVSRCQHFEFKKISLKEIINHLLDITQKEGITISPFGLNLIAGAADGSLRDAQSLLDQAVAFCGEVINDEDLKEILGVISRDILFEASTAIFEEKPERIFSLVDKVIENGHDLRYFYRELIQHFRDLLLVRSLDKPQDLLPLNPEALERLKGEAQRVSAEDLLRYLQALQRGETELKYSSHPQIYLEALLVKLCHFKKIAFLKDLIQEIKEMRRVGPGEVESKEKKQAEPQPSGARPAAPSSPESTPKPDRGDAKEILKRILEVLQKEKGGLASLVAQFSSFRFRGESLEIFFESGKKFFLDTIQKDVKSLEKAASQVLEKEITVKLSEEPNKESGQKDRETDAALKEPIVQHFMSTFKGHVLSVAPSKRGHEAE